ncbi:MAG: zinc-ribbon domain-containing protein [Candidatus Methanomethylophilaceae archaeon]|nr:zinc-ribbon domain-containing protein [Candidatus Methanomethylophilaceae archaeon]
MSEEEQFDLFCTQCGQRLTKDATFCPSCGAQVSEMKEAPAGAPAYGAPYQRDMSGRLKVISIILIITAALFLISAISTFGAADSVIDSMKSDTTSWNNLLDQLNMTSQELEDMIRSIVVALAVTSLISAVLVAVAGVFGLMRKHWGLGFAFCIITTVIQMSIVGLIVTILWYTTKPAFTQ